MDKKETSTCKLISSGESNSLYSHCSSASADNICRLKTKVVFSSKAILRVSDISRVSVNNDQIQELIILANICQMSLEYSFFSGLKYTL